MLNVMATEELMKVNGGSDAGYMVPWYVHDSKGYKCYKCDVWVPKYSRIRGYIDGKPYYGY